MARILLVEDYEPIRRLLTKALELDGHTVTARDNGTQAITVFIDNAHDLVITDMEMPYLSGPELIAEIQQLSPTTPIIGMTCGPLPEPKEQERQRLNIAAMFAKPMDLGALRQTVQKLTAKNVPLADQAA